MTESAPSRSKAAYTATVHSPRRVRFSFTKTRRLVAAAYVIVLLMSVPAIAADAATVIFTLDFPASNPEHYSISVQSNGHATYECSARISSESEEKDNYQTDFDMTPATRNRIFDLAAQAHNFSRKVDSGNARLAFTGEKKLVYQDSRETHTVEYNYSNVPAVQQLTDMFQSLASTLEYGRRLAYYHRYQKLGLDDELKGMETQAKNNALIELQAVEPVLKQLYDDTSVMNVVRARAQRLIEMGKSRASPSR